MRTFGEALKQARLAKRVTLRELGRHLDKSISYLSDVEQGRKGAPDIETVRKIQEFLQVVDNSLVDLALKLRSKLPERIAQRIQHHSQFRDALYRLDDLDDEQFDNLVDQLNSMDLQGGNQ
ncbi:MAG TPA: helix-turn-helix transcriptional regulator [Blastocatellia bacterium]|nr:helix-turn-helix transcriptional regulator [Blastocatellia bacterium]